MGAPIGQDIVEGMDGIIQQRNSHQADLGEQIQQIGYLYILLWVCVMAGIVWFIFFQFLNDPPPKEGDITFQEVLNGILNWL